MVSADDNGAFTPIPQPYSVGTPVRDRAIFFGRQEDFRFVRQRLLAEEDGIVLSLVGPRRSGKTSIMVQILNGELGNEFLPFFVDMQQMAGIVGDREFFARLAALLLEGLADVRLSADYYRFDEGSPILTFDGLLADIQKAHPDKRLLFLIDEAEILESKVEAGELSRDVLTYMSSVLEHRRVSFCLTGSPGMIGIEGEDWRRLTAKGDFLEISYLSREDTYRLVREPVAGQMDYDEGVPERIYQLTAGWPFYVQLTCFYLVVHLNQAQRRCATDDDIDAVVGAIVNNPPPQLVYQWEELDPDAQIALALVGEQSAQPRQEVFPQALLQTVKDNKYPLAFKAEGLKVALEDLYSAKHLERTEEGAYFVRVDLFRQWIRRHRSVWRLVGQNETPRRRWWWAPVPAALAGLAAFVFWPDPAQRQAPTDTAGALPQATIGEVWVEALPADVAIYLDDRLRHQGAPTLLRELTPGPHTVRLEHVDYRPAEQTIEVRPGHTDTLRFAALQRLLGRLSVTTTPAGALVRVQGPADTAGTAPLHGLALPTGTYRVSASRPGHLQQMRQVRIRADRDTALVFALTARTGSVQLTSIPPGARVFMDDRPLEGYTPMRLDRVAEGQHRFRFELDDYRPAERTAEIALDQLTQVSTRLELLPATVHLKTRPPGAQVRLDGADSLWGLTPLTLSLPPGPHRISLTHEGYDPQIIERTWHPGQSDILPPIALERQYGYARFVRPLSGDLYVDDQLKKKGTLGNIRFAVGHYVFRIGTQQQAVEIVKDSTVVVRFGEDDK